MVDGESGESAVCLEKTPSFHTSGKSSITELKDSGSKAGMTNEFSLSNLQKNGIQNKKFKNHTFSDAKIRPHLSTGVIKLNEQTKSRIHWTGCYGLSNGRTPGQSRAPDHCI